MITGSEGQLIVFESLFNLSLPGHASLRSEIKNDNQTPLYTGTHSIDIQIPLMQNTCRES